MRINKYLSKAGYCSRREADKLIAGGLVQVNGKVANIGDDIGELDIVMIKGRMIEITDNDEYILLNKPKGITVTTASHDDTNVIDFINYSERIFPVGRLDKDSEGLLLLTNDGDIVNKILKSKNDQEKEYIVVVDKKITKDFMNKMSSEVKLEIGTTKKSEVKYINENTFAIIITQGLNRQIRRMCEHFGYRVESLKRIRIINLELGDLKLGEWRKLTGKELIKLFKKIDYDKPVKIN